MCGLRNSIRLWIRFVDLHLLEQGHMEARLQVSLVWAVLDETLFFLGRLQRNNAQKDCPKISQITSFTQMDVFSSTPKESRGLFFRCLCF